MRMVFETVISRQLNRFLFKYIENLNSSQLNLGLLEGKTCHCFMHFCIYISYSFPTFFLKEM